MVKTLGLFLLVVLLACTSTYALTCKEDVLDMNGKIITKEICDDFRGQVQTYWMSRPRITRRETRSNPVITMCYLDPSGYVTSVIFDRPCGNRLVDEEINRFLLGLKESTALSGVKNQRYKFKITLDDAEVHCKFLGIYLVLYQMPVGAEPNTNFEFWHVK